MDAKTESPVITPALARALVRCGVAEGNGQAEALSLLTELREQYTTLGAHSYALPLFALLVGDR